MAEAKEIRRFKFEAAPVRFLYGNVITPKVSDYGSGRKSPPHFEVQAGIPLDHPELKALKAQMAAVAKAKFGTTEGVSFPLKDGTKMADKAKGRGKNRERCRGYIVFKASSAAEYPPSLAYMANGSGVDVEDSMRQQSAAKFYPGVWIGEEVTFKAYEGNDGNIPNSVVAYLSNVVSLGFGEKLGGGASSRHAGLIKNVGTISEDDPTDEDIEADIEI